MKLILRLPPPQNYLYSILIALLLGFFFWQFQSTQPSTTHTLDLSGEVPALFANQTNDDLTASFASGIASAKESVLLIVYTLTDPTIIKALKKKSEEGVNVRVITDAMESPYVTSKLGSSVFMNRRFSKGRMHQKILVIDGKVSWIGSANMTSESLRMHGNLVNVIKSAPLAERLEAKALTMDMKAKDSYFLHEEFTIGGQLVELWFLPDDHMAVQCVKDLIHSAKENVRIAMFTWTRMDFAHAAIEAANRGVNVEVVIDGNQGKGVSSRIVELLRNSKVKVSLSRGKPLLHHKFLYVDQSMLVNGSANWTHDAFNKNDECFLIIHNLTQLQQHQMDALWKVISKESIQVKKKEVIE
ncbi:MAG: phosphatidylserine/phosphatidylglycerophosphate/cardiolipin synthase family protein [Parachlamydiaceae bacterium]|nr:phosphatidylserine/phosphatidylglycerophosphate/cardiolipin synthase family protein [Parachlamydiaceae bacterium]